LIFFISFGILVKVEVVRVNVQIVLTSYLLTYMYGDLAFSSSLLLTREVIKKAYNEGLYYVSNEKNIDDILNEGNIKKRRLLTFSGIPSFEEVCMNLSPSKTIFALKINLPYEELATFKYSEKKEILDKKDVVLQRDMLEKKMLYLSYEDGALCYKDTQDHEVVLEEKIEEIEKHFKKEIENYKFAIENRMNFLRKALFEFLETEASKELLEDQVKLQEIKESYEELMS